MLAAKADSEIHFVIVVVVVAVVSEAPPVVFWG